MTKMLLDYVEVIVVIALDLMTIKTKHSKHFN